MTVSPDAESLRQALTQVTEQDLGDLVAWVPPGAAEMVRVLGARLAAKLITLWPGVALSVPMPDSRHASGMARRAELVAALGQEDAAALCAAWGGQVLLLPVMRSLLREKRQRWLRAEFDRLSAQGLTRVRAVTVLGLRLAAAGQSMTSRQISSALDRADAPTQVDQLSLFDLAKPPLTPLTPLIKEA